MTPQELKNSILQLAIQGKLVEQRPEEGVAEVPAARQHGGREARRHGEIEPIDLSDLPFDIPESWRWVHINQIAETSLGKTLDKGKDVGDLCPYLCSINVYWDGISLEKIKEARFSAAEKEKYRLKNGDLLICEGGDVGRAAIWSSDKEMYYQNALHRVRFFDNALPQYFLFVIECYKGLGIIDKYCKGVTIKHFVQSSLCALWLPLPPLAEQKRIVSKIEELLPLLARYEQAWTKLESFNTRFPSDLQKSLLQLAIQGKLVPQLPEEGIAQVPAAPNTEKKKARRHGEEIEPPFDIPESWRWVRLGEVADVQLGKMLDKGKNKGTPHPYLANLSVRWRSFDLSALRTMRFTEPECEKFALLPGDVLMCEGGVPGRCAVWRQEHSPIKYQKAVHRIRSAVLFPDFIQLYFEAIVDNTWFAEQFTGTTIKHLPRERLIQTPIPLPPLAEQKRIVAKLEELLPLCERLKGTSA